MKKGALIVLIGIVGIAVDWLGLLFGWWLITLVTGVLIGIVILRARIVLPVALCVGGLSWGLPLAMLARNAPVERIADVVASIVGLGLTGTELVVITIALGSLLSLAGAWIGIAGRRLPGRAAIASATRTENDQSALYKQRLRTRQKALMRLRQKVRR